MEKSILGIKKAKDEVIKQNKKTNPKKPKKISSEFINRLILISIAIGIWGIFLQNLGIITTNDFTQKVRVVNTVDTYVGGGYIEIDGSVPVEVENTVDVNLREIRGRSVWSATRGGFAVLGVFAENTRLGE